MSMMGLRLGRAGADQLMPMHLVLDEEGGVRHAGPTLAKLAGRDLAGCRMSEVLRFCRPYAAPVPASFDALAGRALQVELIGAGGGAEALPLRAVLVTLPQGGALLEFAPGVRLAQTVRDHGLDVTDFSPVDASIELLFMCEAQALVRGELTRLADSGGASRAWGAGSSEGRDGSPGLVQALADLGEGDGFGLVRATLPPDARARSAALAVLSARLRDGDVLAPAPGGAVLLLAACDDADALAAAVNRLRADLDGTAGASLSLRACIVEPVDVGSPDLVEPARLHRGVARGPSLGDATPSHGGLRVPRDRTDPHPT